VWITHGSSYRAPQRESATRASGSGYPIKRPFPHRHRRPALAFPPARPRGMRNARHLSLDRVRDRRMRRHTTARRGRRDRGALQCGWGFGGIRTLRGTRGMSKLLAPDGRDDLRPEALEVIAASAPAVSAMPIGRPEEPWEDRGASTRRAVGSTFRVPPGASPLRRRNASRSSPLTTGEPSPGERSFASRSAS